MKILMLTIISIAAFYVSTIYANRKNYFIAVIALVTSIMTTTYSIVIIANDIMRRQ